MKTIRNTICFVLIIFTFLVNVSIAETESALPKIYVNNVPVVFLDKEGIVINPTVIEGELYVPLTALLDTLMIDYSGGTEKFEISTNTQIIAEPETEKITITPENFEEYFDIKVDKKYDTEWTGEFAFSHHYDVTCYLTMTVTALYPCDINNLSFTVNCHYYRNNEKGEEEKFYISIPFVMPQSGTCVINKEFQWNTVVNGLEFMDDEKREKEARYMYFFVDDVVIESGSINLKNT